VSAKRRRFELADEQIAIDRLVRGEIGHRRELGQPALGGRGSCRPAGDAQVRPAVVVAVLADGRGERRVEAEELGKEGLDAVAEVGHVGESKGVRLVRRARLPV